MLRPFPTFRISCFRVRSFHAGHVGMDSCSSACEHVDNLAFVEAVPPQVSRDIVKDPTATPVAFEASSNDPGR